MPGLGVGLHLVVIEGDAVLPRSGELGPAFGSDQLRLGVEYYFSPAGRRRLWAEVVAQYRAFAATGLRLDHANAHKHMHLHPTVGRMLIEAGREFGLGALRVPAEPPGLAGAASWGDRALFAWTRVLRAQGRAAGLRMNDWVLGLGWSGGMTRERLLAVAPALPAGLGEIYFHPATGRNRLLERSMPGYAHEAELDTLLDPAVQAALSARGRLSGWRD